LVTEGLIISVLILRGEQPRTSYFYRFAISCKGVRRTSGRIVRTIKSRFLLPFSG
jgi:hypothetical protein